MHLIELLAKFAEERAECDRDMFGVCATEHCALYVGGRCRRDEAVKCATQVARKIAKVNEERKNWSKWMRAAMDPVDGLCCHCGSSTCHPHGVPCDILVLRDTYPFEHDIVRKEGRDDADHKGPYTFDDLDTKR